MQPFRRVVAQEITHKCDLAHLLEYAQSRRDDVDVTMRILLVALVFVAPRWFRTLRRCRACI